MASNSVAERIVRNVVAVLEGVPTVASVTRAFPSVDEIRRCASTEFPKAAVVAGLPEVESWGNNVNESKSRVISELPLKVFLYLSPRKGKESEEALSLIDDLWAAILGDPLRAGLCMDTTVEPNAVGQFGNVVACRLDVRCRYLHNGGSI